MSHWLCTVIGNLNTSLLTTKKQNLNIVFHLSLHISTAEQSVLVKTTGYAVHLRIVPLLVSFML